MVSLLYQKRDKSQHHFRLHLEEPYERPIQLPIGQLNKLPVKELRPGASTGAPVRHRVVGVIEVEHAVDRRQAVTGARPPRHQRRRRPRAQPGAACGVDPKA